MNTLIGYSGLLGVTLREKIKFDFLFNSKNISTFGDVVPDGTNLFLSCLPATKWQVNMEPKKDFENLLKILDILSHKSYSTVTLFSTIDVYNNSPMGADERHFPNIRGLNYGDNRYYFELLIREYLKTENLLILRLPAIFNKHIKKNIIFDLLNNNNVEKIQYNSSFQWYNLDNLFGDVMKYSSLGNDKIVNLFPEPLETSEILNFFPEYKTFDYSNQTRYNYKTVFGGYIYDKDRSLKEIEKFIIETRSK
jgi:hypothetical protein